MTGRSRQQQGYPLVITTPTSRCHRMLFGVRGGKRRYRLSEWLVTLTQFELRESASELGEKEKGDLLAW